jgi:predicted nucleic acid-binding protein
MTQRFLLDTNILSEPLRPQPNSDVLQKLRQHGQVISTAGKNPAYADGQIAAIAQVNNLTLVTNNVSDYADFADLKLENWFTSLQ